MADATYRTPGCIIDHTPSAALVAGDMVQLKDGRAGFALDAIAASAEGSVQVDGIVRLTKTTGVAILDGGRVYWDHSASTATYKAVNDRDFYIGMAVGDSLSEAAAATVDVALNVRPSYLAELQRSAFISALAGTSAAGGFGYPVSLGGGSILELSATSEAQKVDLMSVEGFAIASNPIVECQFRIINDGSNATQDFTIGMASGTHATDFQSVAEFVAFSTVGGSTAVNGQSDDGTTDNAPATTGVSYTEGSALASRVEGWIDARNSSDVQLYINGANVIGGTAFTLAAATGPLFLIAHLEKTTGTDVYKVGVDMLNVRLGQE